MTEYSAQALPAAKHKMQVKPSSRWVRGMPSKYTTLWFTAIMLVIFPRPISRQIMSMFH